MRREHGRHIVCVKECGSCLYQGHVQVFKQARTLPVAYDRKIAGTRSKEGEKKEDKDDNEEAILVQTQRKNTLKTCYVGFTLT